MEDTNSLFDREPIMSRFSDVFGLIEMYPPRGEASNWASLPWVIRTEKGGPDGHGIKLRVKAEYVMQAYNRPSFVTKEMQYYA